MFPNLKAFNKYCPNYDNRSEYYKVVKNNIGLKVIGLTKSNAHRKSKIVFISVLVKKIEILKERKFFCCLRMCFLLQTGT